MHVCMLVCVYVCITMYVTMYVCMYDVHIHSALRAFACSEAHAEAEDPAAVPTIQRAQLQSRVGGNMARRVSSGTEIHYHGDGV